jgi:hypothetical protein
LASVVDRPEPQPWPGGAEEQRGTVAPASERIVNLLSEMEAHPAGSATDDAVRAGLITRLSAALIGLRAELD